MPIIQKSFIPFAIVAAILAAWFSWFGRYTTNTAGGRFYKTDRWTGTTIVVEKNGHTHLLAFTDAFAAPRTHKSR